MERDGLEWDEGSGAAAWWMSGEGWGSGRGGRSLAGSVWGWRSGDPVVRRARRQP